MALAVSADGRYGNVADVAVRDGDAPEVAFAAHPHGGPECLWFCFRVSDDSPRRGPLRLVLKHYRNMLGGGDPAAMRPVIRRPDTDWTRLGPGRAEDLPDGRRQAVWETERPQPWLEVAYCYPYGTPEIEALAAETAGRLRMDTIGVSAGGRPLVRLATDVGGGDGTRPGVYCVARQHSGETPGSWALDGFLRRLTELGDAAPLCWAVPLANIDGVEAGDYGKDNYPYDLNRAWGGCWMRHETLVIGRDIELWRRRCRPTLAIDWHAPGACETGGVYAYLPHPKHGVAAYEAMRPWSEAFAAGLGELAADDFGRVADYASRWETPNFTRWCAQSLGVPAITFEVPYALAGETVFTRDLYREAGRRIADVVVARS